MELWLDYLKTFGWGVVGAVTMAVSLWILLKVSHGSRLSTSGTS